MLAFIANGFDVLLHSEDTVYFDAIEGQKHSLCNVRMHKEKHNDKSADELASEFGKRFLLDLSNYAPK